MWERLPVFDAVLLSYEFPTSIKEIKDKPFLTKKQPIKTQIKIATNAFDEGSERVAYYGQDLISKTDIVLKRYISPKGFLNSATHYETSIQVQTIAAYMASKFTIELEKVLSIFITKDICLKFMLISFCYIC